jgi:hypothetical protein
MGVPLVDPPSGGLEQLAAVPVIEKKQPVASAVLVESGPNTRNS